MLVSLLAMSRSALFYNYVMDCYSSLEKSLEQYLESGDNEKLYRCRVAMKKIRNVIKCLSIYHGDAVMNQAGKPLKKVFRLSGAVRELQLAREWLRKHHFKRLIRRLKVDDRIKQANHRFLRHKPDDKIEKGKETTLGFSEMMTRQQVFHYYLTLIQGAVPYVMHPSPDPYWHEARKKLKEVLYARHWQEGGGLRVISKSQAAFLDKWQRAIGEWHDKEDMAAWLTQEEGNQDGHAKASAMEEISRAKIVLQVQKDKWYRKTMGLQTRSSLLMRSAVRRLETALKGIP